MWQIGHQHTFQPCTSGHLAVLLQLSFNCYYMIITSEALLQRIAIHKSGNSGKEEGIRISKAELRLRDEVKDLLTRYFLSPFSKNEYYNLFHESDLQLNEVYHYATEIFGDQDTFFNNSINFTRHLYAKSIHPMIKPGEFYIVYFKDVILDGEEVDAIGLFKSESRETFLKVFPTEDNYLVEHEEGININKLEKGCLIFNSEPEKGYVCAVIDTSGKSTDTRYWFDEFLKLKERDDDFLKTREAMELTRQFVSNKLPDSFDIDRPAQAELLNKSMKFFKENDNFKMEEFVGEVFADKEVINTFNEYRKDFEAERQTKITDEFDISGLAVKKQSKIFKSILKLDKNFHIYIHGNRDNIEKGYDNERNLNFYKIYFDEES
jgi:hypothetical protein